MTSPGRTHRPPDADHHPAVTFVSGHLSEAVATATGAAAGRNVVVFGANLAAQCLRAGLLDEIVIHLVPVLLGDGVRLIDAPDLGPIALERTLVTTAGQSPTCGLPSGTAAPQPPDEAPW